MWNEFRVLAIICTVSYGIGILNGQHGAEYYRARATEMMEKAQKAPTKTVRLAYLNLAHKWAEEAEKLEAAAERESAAVAALRDPPDGA